MYQFFLNLHYELLSCSSKYLIPWLICLVLLDPLDGYFGQTAQTNLNFQMNLLKLKIRKKTRKIFSAHQKFSNILHALSVCA